MKITLKQLRIFVEVAKTQSISQGASKSFISQSAASISISQLENNLGIVLFDRRRKKLTLNSDGQTLFLKAIEILEKADEFELYNIPDHSLHGNLTIAANPIIANYILPKLIARFNTQYPKINISLISNNLETSFENIEKEICDIGFVEGRTAFHKLNVSEIIIKKANLKIICSLNHILTTQDKVSIDDIFNYQWVQHDDSLSSRDITIKKFNKDSKVMQNWIGKFDQNDNISLNDVVFNNNGEIIKENTNVMKKLFILPSIESVKNYVANSDYLALLSENCINKFEINNLYRVLDVKDFLMTRNHRIILKKDKSHTKIVKLFSNWLQEQQY